MKHLLLIFIFFASIRLHAQDHVLTVQGDTLRGEIHILLPNELFEEILIDAGGEKQRLKAYQFIRFTDGDDIYHTVKYRNVYRIMKVEKAGYLTKYLFRANQNYEFATTFLHKQTGEGLEVPNFSFRKQISTYLNDCPQLVEAIDNKELAKRDLDRIVDRYNACIDQKAPTTLTQTSGNNDKAYRTIQLIEQMRKRFSQEEELIALLLDIQRKLESNSPIPAYMLSALEAHSVEGLDKVIEALKQ